MLLLVASPKRRGWRDLWRLRRRLVRRSKASFASIASPQFTGEPTAPTPEVADASTLLATTQFVARDALLKSGGQMSGPLITMPGTNATNPGLAIGDNSTGFYRPSERGDGRCRWRLVPGAVHAVHLCLFCANQRE